jgi:sulfur carrier protein ThiS
MTEKVSLQVNGTAIELDHFVFSFLEHTVIGMLGSLKDTAPVSDLNLSIDGDKVSITLNGKAVPTNRFASKIIKSTMVGMVSPLKGVSRVNNLQIEIAR